jgi:hypothetical protein
MEAREVEESGLSRINITKSNAYRTEVCDDVLQTNILAGFSSFTIVQAKIFCRANAKVTQWLR